MCVRHLKQGSLLGTPEAGAGSMTNLGKCCGVEADGVAKTEADHFGNYPVCRAYLDMRDLGQMLAHIHDAEIEICEGPELPLRWAVHMSTKMKEAAN
jgi:hypothetical protein